MKSTKQRFEEKFRFTPGCWEWTANLGVWGYGTFWRANSMQYAHRVSYEMYVGPIPDGMNICHRCDNPKCVNPEHLFIGTAKDNVHDMIAKGRRRQKKQSGILNPSAKLSDQQVILIRSGNDSAIDAAHLYGVTEPYVLQIRAGLARKYSEVTDLAK